MRVLLREVKVKIMSANEESKIRNRCVTLKEFNESTKYEFYDEDGKKIELSGKVKAELRNIIYDKNLNIGFTYQCRNSEEVKRTTNQLGKLVIDALIK